MMKHPSRRRLPIAEVQRQFRSELEYGHQGTPEKARCACHQNVHRTPKRVLISSKLALAVS